MLQSQAHISTIILRSILRILYAPLAQQHTQRCLCVRAYLSRPFTPRACCQVELAQWALPSLLQRASKEFSFFVHDPSATMMVEEAWNRKAITDAELLLLENVESEISREMRLRSGCNGELFSLLS